jgi:hypothetical protein
MKPLLRVGIAALVLSASVNAGTPIVLDRKASERAVLFAEGTISTPGFETSGTFSKDRREFYFTKGAPDFGECFFTIVVSRYADGRWSEPEIAPFSGQYDDTSPFLSPDGSKLVFSSNRPVNGVGKARNDFDLWIVERRGGRWSEPRNLGPRINTTGWEMHSSMTNDGTLYFGAIRPGTENYDIYRARLRGGEYEAPQNLGPIINTAGTEYDPYVAADESYLIFGSTRHPGNLGSADLYISFRQNAEWEPPMNLGPKVNTPRREAGGFVAKLDGRYYLFFNSESGHELSSAIRPDRPLQHYRQLQEILGSVDNRVRNFYYVEIKALDIRHPTATR